jgi:nicotinic acid mononucleotide adenylyltransferase
METHLWPHAKLVTNVQRLYLQPGSENEKKTKKKRKCAVLVTTGALNPVHRGHIEMLEVARRALADQLPDCPVVAGFISPSHDLYVEPKCRRYGSHFWSATHRAAMVDLAIADSDWLDCGRWETAQTGYWPDFPEVCAAAMAHVTTVLGNGGGSDADCAAAALPADVQVRVFYVCGTDLFYKCGLGRRGAGRTWGGGVVVVTREGGRQPPSDPASLVFAAEPAAADAATAGFSSTTARALLEQGASAAELSRVLHPAVTEFLTTGPGRGASDPPIVYDQMYDHREPVPAELMFAAAAAPDAAGPVAAAPDAPRLVFISASSLAAEWGRGRIPPGTLEAALCFFGSKRRWLFPSTAEEEQEAMGQPGQYHLMDAGFLAAVAAKEARGEVHFLKVRCHCEVTASHESLRECHCASRSMRVTRCVPIKPLTGPLSFSAEGGPAVRPRQLPGPARPWCLRQGLALAGGAGVWAAAARPDLVAGVVWVCAGGGCHRELPGGVPRIRRADGKW